MPAVHHRKRQAGCGAGKCGKPSVTPAADGAVDILLEEQRRFRSIVPCQTINDRTGRHANRSGGTVEALKNNQAGRRDSGLLRKSMSEDQSQRQCGA
jgi:hypothetical protein